MCQFVHDYLSGFSYMLQEFYVANVEYANNYGEQGFDRRLVDDDLFIFSYVSISMNPLEK